VAAAGFYVIDEIDGAQVQRIGGQTVKSVGRHADHLTGFDLSGNVGNQAEIGRFRIDLDDFSGQSYSQSSSNSSGQGSFSEKGRALPVRQTIKNKPAWEENLERWLGRQAIKSNHHGRSRDT
jgi:hypothetical protein